MSEQTLPISVVIPHLKSREDFFRSYCLPSVEHNRPREIHVLDGDENNQWKRNKGASLSSQEFLFFCDDDVILSRDFLKKLLEGIGDHDFAYCDYLAANYPNSRVKRHTAREFDLKALRKQNYISTMSLVRKSAFPGFDERIESLQDWDMFLTMTSNGSTGVYVANVHFIAYWIDEGISGNSKKQQNARSKVMRKHKLS
jgi:glycosyltransferase involved in cell wall biosynthesis